MAADSVQNWTPFRGDFPAFVLGSAFAVVRSGKIDKAGAELLAHCAVELELWALGAYFGTRPVVGASLGAHPELSDEQAHALLAQHAESAIVPAPISTSGGNHPRVAAPVSLTPAAALRLALWLLKTAAEVLL